MLKKCKRRKKVKKGYTEAAEILNYLAKGCKSVTLLGPNLNLTVRSKK